MEVKVIRGILKTSAVAGALSFLSLGFSQPALHAQVLEGNISKTGTIMRLSRPSGNSKLNTLSKMPPVAPPIRLSRSRTPAGNLTAMKGGFDVSTFKNSFAASARKDGLRSGVAKVDDFVSKNKFDLGADRNSRELTLAWERWHKQFSKAIYDTWSAMADEPGKSTLKVIVNRNKQISIVIVDSDASPRFNRQLRKAILSLNGNPGLSFPTKSKRQSVSFEADYIAARNVVPGYSWVKDDYETIRENF